MKRLVDDKAQRLDGVPLLGVRTPSVLDNARQPGDRLLPPALSEIGPVLFCPFGGLAEHPPAAEGEEPVEQHFKGVGQPGERQRRLLEEFQLTVAWTARLGVGFSHARRCIGPDGGGSVAPTPLG